MPRILPSSAARREVGKAIRSTVSSGIAFWRTCGLANSASHLPDWSSTTISIRLARLRRQLPSAHAVNVLVSNSNFESAQLKYQTATDDPENLTAENFLLPPSELTIERMHKLMAFSERSDAVPLHMEVIQRILRQMAASGQDRSFKYGVFLQLLDQAGLSTEQQRPMRLRLDLCYGHEEG